MLCLPLTLTLDLYLLTWYVFFDGFVSLKMWCSSGQEMFSSLAKGMTDSYSGEGRRPAMSENKKNLQNKRKKTCSQTSIFFSYLSRSWYVKRLSKCLTKRQKKKERTTYQSQVLVDGKRHQPTSLPNVTLYCVRAEIYMKLHCVY